MTAAETQQQPEVTPAEVEAGAGGKPGKPGKPGKASGIVIKQVDKKEGTLDEIQVRVVRTVVIGVVPLLMLIIFVGAKLSIHQTLGVSLLIMYVVFFLGLAWKLFRAPLLWRVYSFRGAIPNWAKMAVTYQLREFPCQSIQSISEFSAIEGASANVALMILSLLTWAIVIFHTLFDLSNSKGRFSTRHKAGHEITASVCGVVGAFGILLIGIWDDNPHVVVNRVVHYTGVGFGCGTVLAYCIELKFRADTIIFAVLFITFYAIWLYSCHKGNTFSAALWAKYGHDKQYTLSEKERLQVRRNSLYCLCSEGAAIYIASLCLSLWVFSKKSF